MHKQRLVAAIAAGLGMLATFMPWVQAPIIGSVPGSKGDGWITFTLFAIALALTVAKDRERPLAGGVLYAGAASGVAAAAVGLWKIIDFNRAMGGADADSPFAKAMMASVSIGFGLYLMVAAGAVVAGVGFLLKEPAGAAAPAP